MPHLREENEYWRTPEFLEFTGKTEYRLLKFLMAHIVRESKGPNVPTGARKMFRAYYKNGMLCASYGMNNIARYFGWFVKNKKTGEPEPNRGYVSRLIKKLKKEGLLEIIRVPTPVGEKFVYQLGYIEKGKEVLFFDQVFSAKAKLHRLRKSMKEDKIQTVIKSKPDTVRETEADIISLKKEQGKQVENNLKRLKIIP